MRSRAGCRPAAQPHAEVSFGGHRMDLGPLFGARAPTADAGGALAPGTGEARAAPALDAEEERAAADLAAWLKGGPDLARPGFGETAGSADRGGSTGGRERLLGSSFSVTAETASESFVSFWGRTAVTRFDGREGPLTLDGEVTSAMLGTDWSQGPWTAGLLVSHSLGGGGYRNDEDGAARSGTIEATLTGFYPWLRYALLRPAGGLGCGGLRRGASWC